MQSIRIAGETPTCGGGRRKISSRAVTDDDQLTAHILGGQMQSTQLLGLVGCLCTAQNAGKSAGAHQLFQRPGLLIAGTAHHMNDLWRNGLLL